MKRIPRTASLALMGAAAASAMLAGGGQVLHASNAAAAAEATQTCKASWYTAPPGAKTASGETFNPNARTAAHKSLPFGSIVTVTGNGRSVDVRINDRGPFVAGRCIDLTPAAFKALAPLGAGVIPVTVRAH
jgi:rare lipoprotein A